MGTRIPHRVWFCRHGVLHRVSLGSWTRELCGWRKAREWFQCDEHKRLRRFACCKRCKGPVAYERVVEKRSAGGPE